MISLDYILGRADALRDCQVRAQHGIESLQAYIAEQLAMTDDAETETLKEVEMLDEVGARR